MTDQSSHEILVVDDTSANLRLLSALLADHGYRVRAASSGPMALRSAMAAPPDLILLDVRMPEMDGFEVCRQLKKDQRLRPIPVIFVSALSEASDKVEGFAVGAVDFVTKPIEPDEVLARVRTHLELLALQRRQAQVQIELEQRVAERTADLEHAHRALQASEERLRLVIDATSDAIWDWNPTSGEMYFSDRWYTMLEHLPGEFAAGFDGWRDRIHPDDLAQVKTRVETHLQGNSPELSVEYRMRTRSRGWTWIQSRGRVIERDVAGNPQRMVGTNVDVTARRVAQAALDESLTRFTSFAEATEYGFSMADLDFNITYANPALAGMFGEDGAASVIGHSVLTFHAPEFGERLRQQVLPTLFEQGHWQGEAELLALDGRRIPVEENLFLIRDSEGNPRYIGDIVTDITARKEAEQRLQFTNALLSAEQAASIDGILVVDDTGKIISSNPRFAQIWGISQSMLSTDCDELVLRSVLDKLVAPQSFLDKIKFLYANPEATNQEEIALKDGRVIDRNSCPMRGADGRYYGRIWFFRDITERKRAEEALRTSEAFYRAIFHNSLYGIGITGSDMKLTQVNPAFCKMLGYQNEELIGKLGIGDITHPDDLPSSREAVGRMLGGEIDDFTLEKRYVTKSGKIIHALAFVNAIRDASGAYVASSASILDISEKKGAEAEIAAALREKETLLMEIYHRVKNNLQVVSSLLAMQGARAGDEARALLETSADRVRSIALVHEQLYQSKNLSSISYPAYVRELVAHLTDAYDPISRRVPIVAEIDDLSIGVGTAVPLGLVITELISNAYKHAFPGEATGEIQVMLNLLPSGLLRLTVRDTGRGLPPGFTGSGASSLGLRLVETLASQLDGRIDVSSPAGACFELTFAPEGQEATFMPAAAAPVRQLRTAATETPIEVD
jgi:PAS domain S-box-containing protein